MAKITTIGDLSLVKSAVLIGKTGPRFPCLHIAAISFTLPAAKCQGERCLTPTALPVSRHPILTSDAPTDITRMTANLLFIVRGWNEDGLIIE